MYCLFRSTSLILSGQNLHFKASELWLGPILGAVIAMQVCCTSYLSNLYLFTRQISTEAGLTDIYLIFPECLSLHFQCISGLSLFHTLLYLSSYFLSSSASFILTLYLVTSLSVSLSLTSVSVPVSGSRRSWIASIRT